MLSGFKGVKYGLAVPKKEPKPGPQKTLAAFAEDESDDENQVARAVERQAQRKQSDAKVAKLQQAALAEDPSIFDYDSHFDSIQEQREGPKLAEQQARKSRYIEGLLDKAKERQREQDIVYERRLLNERKAEDHLFGDKERFLTAAYKRKLEEDKKWLEEEALRDAVEAEQDVRKRGHMGDFYRNLLTNNVAMGTGEARKFGSAAAKPAAEAGGPTQPGTDAPGASGGLEWQQLRQAREAYEAKLAGQGAGADTVAAEERRVAEAGPAASEGTLAPAAAPESDERTGDAASGDAATAGQSTADDAPPAVSREDKAAAARDRYLARKRKAPS